jgi:hypothetical protein
MTGLLSLHRLSRKIELSPGDHALGHPDGDNLPPGTEFAFSAHQDGNYDLSFTDFKNITL